MTHAWKVHTMMDDGSSYETVVLARTGPDAGVLVGNMVRAARGIDVVTGDAGIWGQDVQRLSDEYVKVAINHVFRTDLFPRD